MDGRDYSLAELQDRIAETRKANARIQALEAEKEEAEREMSKSLDVIERARALEAENTRLRLKVLDYWQALTDIAGLENWQNKAAGDVARAALSTEEKP